ncbi:MAG TPA: ABC transporter permease [Acidimicrobiales bacterium]|nr:ABC transporter permease [Acidimicrobiales bacterium]
MLGNIATTSIRRLVRDRTSLFFMVVLPLLVIIIVGATIGSDSAFRVAVVGPVDTPLAADLGQRLDDHPAIETKTFDDLDDARTALRRVELDAVVVIPDDLDAVVATGGTATIEVLGEQVSESNRAALTAIGSVVDDHAIELTAGRIVAEGTGTGLDAALVSVQESSGDAVLAGVEAQVVDARSDFLPGGFENSAPTMLVLFVFINALTGGAALIQSRKLGIHARMLAGPVTPLQIVSGEAAGYFLVSLLQSVIIIGAGGLLFGVDWGDPVAAISLVLVWSAVGTGAGMLSGALFRTPEQATSVGVTIGIVFGMLGGTMWPLEIVGPVMQTIGHVVPHGWAVDGWIEVMARGGGVADIATELLVLLGFAVLFVLVASTQLRRRMLD